MEVVLALYSSLYYSFKAIYTVNQHSSQNIYMDFGRQLDKNGIKIKYKTSRIRTRNEMIGGQDMPHQNLAGTLAYRII